MTVILRMRIGSTTASSGEPASKLQNPRGDAAQKFKPTPTDAAKYDGQQEPRSWIDDYMQTVILHKGNQIAAMQCLQLYLKDSARAWLRGLPKGSIKSWDDLVDVFVANFQATYKRPVGIEELRNCQQKQKESMRSYIGRFTKLLNAAEDVSVDRAIDAFSDAVRRESYIEELGRKKTKTITKLMEIANSWADGEDNVRRPRQRDGEDDDQPKHDSGGEGIVTRREENRNYDDNNLVVRIAAKFGSQQEIVDPLPKLSIREIKEEKHVRETKKKPADLALEASAEASAAKASAAKGSAVDGTEDIGDSKTATIVQTPGEINNAAATTNVVKKLEDEKNPFLA
ncbi:hypothetical protein QYE76_024772 [Lolium multiflorum]|uniref:Retrotransposon gag domain-containing protein n=1 Tax=Lolium multiflorum TaxID=4521 RepID=A0AAD8REA9_LOLMU|nr:hypothetical protein QYE76_024772 [Lolium multiflorum]